MRTIPYVRVMNILIAADNEWMAKNLDPVKHPPFAQQAEFEIAVGEEIAKMCGCTRWWPEPVSDSTDVPAPNVDELIPEVTSDAVEILRAWPGRVQAQHEKFMQEKRCHMCDRFDDSKGESCGLWDSVLMCFCDELDQKP